MKEWNLKKGLWTALYAVLYAVMTAVVCVLGAIHPVMFVCYQVTAAVLVSGVVITAFRKLKAPGVALCLATGLLLLFVIIGDAVAWHVIPVIVIGVIAEVVRVLTKYSWSGDLIGTAIMSFSSFGYYGQIWFNRDYTYYCAVEEMPAGYADTLMSVSPTWAFVVVIIAGVVISVAISNVTAKIFKLDK